MTDIEPQIEHTLALVRQALTAVEADGAALQEAVERIERTSGGAIDLPQENPIEALQKIERILTEALAKLQAAQGTGLG